MSASYELSIPSLRTLLRPAPPLAPEDSVARFIQMLRNQPAYALPVLHNGFVCGSISASDVLPILESQTADVREELLRRPVSELMRLPVAVATVEMDVETIGRLCAHHELSVIPVVESDGYCLGVIYACDLLVPDPTPPRPASIGGMATPFGVYLTDGTIQAGASNLALMTTGFAMGVMMLLSYGAVTGAIWLGERYGHLPHSPVFNLDYTPPAGQPLLGLESIALQIVILAIFLLLMRVTRLAGFHAAEHQTVHALERGELLRPEIVKRMPRPHPRCGTNLVAAGMLFFTLLQVFTYIPYFSDLGIIVAALTTMFTWRPFGTFLQARFTTKPATDRELASGIAAGSSLMTQYAQRMPGRTRPLRRIWCMGLLQVMSGSILMGCLARLVGIPLNLW